MEINETINKCFDETFAQIQKISKAPRELDTLLIGVLHCARKYCNAIFVLLGNEHKMPAAALLRILCELYVKMRWCFKVSDKADKPATGNIIFQRFRQWDYARVIENRKILRNISKIRSGDYKQQIDKALKEAEKSVANYKNQGLRCMPNTAKIFKELPEEWSREVYPWVYQNFSRAVHVDMKLIREMVRHSGGQLQCFSDPPSYKTSELLLYCISMGCDINRLLRRHYGCDYDKMQCEYDTIVHQSGKTKKDEL